MELILTIISVNLCFIGYILNEIYKQFKINKSIRQEIDMSKYTIGFDPYVKKAKQQSFAKRIYSEEEVINLLIECSNWQLPQTDEDISKIKQWFEKFKNK